MLWEIRWFSGEFNSPEAISNTCYLHAFGASVSEAI